MKILVTGSTGFLGKPLIKALIDLYTVKDIFSVIRRGNNIDNGILIDNIDSKTNWGDKIIGIDSVIHCAARVHVMNDIASDPIEAFREVNVRGTKVLALAAANAGVKRFVFISSIKVNGESTDKNKPFKADDSFIPVDPYGLSKYEAEVELRKIAKDTGMEVVIIRPPLVYGPGVKANFSSMMRLAAVGIPLPFGGIQNNRRSLVSVYNLVDLIVNCISNPKAANQTFLVSDDDDLSTAKMIKELSVALGRNSKMITLPVKLIEILGKLSGKSAIVERLCSSLQVDISKTKQLLNWSPPVSVKEGFARTAEHHLNNK